MRRAILGLACLLTLVGTSVSGAGARGAAPTRLASTLHGTLTIFDWGVFGGPPPPPLGKRIVKAYERMHPGVTIKTIAMPPGDPTIWQESNLAAGTAPDIISPSYTQQVFGDLPKHYWLDLTAYLNQPNPYIHGNRRWIDSMDPTMVKQNSFKGTSYYVVSWNAQDASFYYNKDLFRAAGITHTPTTWAQLQADAARIQKARIIPFLYYLGDTYPIGENGSVVSLLESQVMSATFKRLDRDHNGIVDIGELVYGIKHRIYSPMNKDYQEAWRLFKQWSQYWEPNSAGNKGPYNAAETVADQLFLKGKAAMVYHSTGFTGILAQDKVKFHWGIFEMPQITSASSRFATPERKGVGIWGAWNAFGWGIPATTKARGHLALALDFLRWISAPQNEVPLSLYEGLYPVAKSYKPTATVSHVIGDLLKHPTMQFAAESTLGPEWLKNRIATEQNYILGMESLSQAMADMQRYTDQAANRLIKIYHLSV